MSTKPERSFFVSPAFLLLSGALITLAATFAEVDKGVANALSVDEKRFREDVTFATVLMGAVGAIAFAVRVPR